MKIKAKMAHGRITCNSIHNSHECGLDLGGIITLFLIICFMIDNMDYIKMAKFAKVSN
jgi:hypothetical protein